MTKNNIIDTDQEISKVSEAVAVYGSTPLKRVHRARHGVTSHFVTDLLAKFMFSKQELALLIAISPKTLDRHLQGQKAFSGLQAERLLRLGDLYMEGIGIFGNQSRFLKWLNSEVIALDATTPRSWLDTQQGIDLISDEMVRIQHGVFA